MIAPSTRKSATHSGSLASAGKSNGRLAMRSAARLARGAEEVLGVEALGRGDLDDRLVAVVVLHAERAGDHRMHGIERGDVGELEDLLVAPEGLELVEHRDRRAP